MDNFSAKYGMLAMEDIINGDTKNLDAIKENEEKIRKTQVASKIEEQKIRMSKAQIWVKTALDVIDRDLLDDYKKILTDFILSGPGTGELMDLSMSVLITLKYSTIEDAKELFCSTEEEMDRFFIQNMAYMFSDKGPDFVTQTLKRSLTAEEIIIFDSKRVEIQQRRENDGMLNNVTKK